MKADPRVDAYIAKSADFAKPVLKYIREVMHAACPDGEETMKWSTPTFMYHGILAGMAAFKEHGHFHFWKGALIKDKSGKSVNDRLANFTKVSDLPSKRELTAYVKRGMKLNEQGAKVPKRKAAPKAAIKMPEYFAKALKRNKKAAAAFEEFSPSHRREYLEWITSAKQEATRERRVQTAIEWLAEGKPRNWKYM
jgi:uncharacterized protein YdeI (YjbR/CyaY-like superfamily)